MFSGQIILDAGEEESISYSELDYELISVARRNIPSLIQKRTEIYSIPKSFAN